VFSPCLLFRILIVLLKILWRGNHEKAIHPFRHCFILRRMRQEQFRNSHLFRKRLRPDNMTATGSGQQSLAPAAKLFTAATTSLSDPTTNITTTYQGGDVSINADSTAELQGSIINDTPDTVQGFWYCAQMLPGVWPEP
jgi:hypothetical protein